MRLMYLSHAAGLSHGSVKALLSIVSEMRKRGHEVLVLFPQQGEAIGLCNNMGVQTIVIPFYSSLYPKFTSFRTRMTFLYHVVKENVIINYRAVKRLEAEIEQFKPDIFHTNVGTVNVGLYAAKKKGIPHVWHIRENAEGFFSYKAFPSFRHKKNLQEKNDANIAITNDLFHTYLLSTRNSFVVYDGVFEKNSAPDVIWNKEKYFLFVGSLSKNKGIDWAVNSFLRIKDEFPDYSLKVAGVGSSPFIQELKTRCEHEDLRKQVVFLGYRSDVYSLMQKATATLIPSVMEGFGFTTAEAMFNGCLVLGRNTGGTKEQFDNGVKLTGDEIGLRFETEEQLVEHMRLICTNGLESYKDMMQNAQKTVLALYTSDHNADDILKIYENLIKKKKLR